MMSFSSFGPLNGSSYAVLLAGIFLSCETVLAVPKVGDMLSLSYEATEDGKLLSRSEVKYEYLAYDAASDLFTLRQTSLGFDVTKAVNLITLVGEELSKQDAVQLAKLNYCAKSGRVKILKIKSGQSVATCKTKTVFPDGHSVLYHDAAIPGWTFAREEHRSSKIDGAVLKTVREVTAYISN